MADDYLSLQRFPGDGVTTDFTVSFAGGAGDTQQGTHPYIDIADVKAYELVPGSGTAPSQRIPRTVQILGPLTFRVAPAVPVGRVLELSRESEDRYNLVDFRTLQTVSEFDLDLAVRQLLYVTQESSDRSSLALTGSEDANQVAADALNVAGNAFTQSTEALSVSGQALTRSNSAISIANAATNTANSASTAADQAVDMANTANSTASAALTTANAAETTADAASDTADAATIAAGLATNTANTALGTANNALTLANTAITTSDDALDVAEDALTVAEAAETTAGAANDTAINAEQVALGISGAVDAAVITANTAFDMAEEAIQAVESAGVASFNGRAGLVLPESGDYSADMVEFGAGTVADELVDLSDRVDNTTSLADVENWWTGTGNQAKLDTVEEGAEVNTVTSVHGRTGAVTAQSGDYSVAQITGSGDLVDQVDRPSLERYPSVQAAFGSTTSSTLWGIPGKVYNYVSASTPNPLGIQVPSEAILRDTVTREIVNPYTHNEMVWGQEFLHSWYDEIRTSMGAGGIVHFSGDSTTAGNGLTDPSFQLHALFNKIANREGILTPTPAVNIGFPSESTENLKNLRALQITSQAVSGDVVVLRWGLNDPFHGIPIETTAANLEASILTLKSRAGLSIVLMTPNAADTPTDGASPRNAVWSEQMQRVVRRLAFKHGCAFIDTYGLFQNAERGSNKWLDSGKLHPKETLNALIASKVFEVLVPSALLAKYGGQYRKFLLPLARPWGNFVTGPESAMYSRDGNNIVTLTGLLWEGPDPQPTITTIGILPVGYRPDSTRRFAVYNSIVAIDSIGTVMHIGESNNRPPSSAIVVGLDGISFKAVVP